MSTLPLLVLCFLLLAATTTDLLSRRIPNWLIASGVIAALLFSTFHPVFLSLREVLAGAATGLMFLLPGYLMGRMGAGDIKLLSMVGSIIGYQSVFMAGLYAFIAGAFIALAWQPLRQRCNISDIRKNSLVGRIVANPDLPFAPAIAVGTAMALIINI